MPYMGTEKIKTSEGGLDKKIFHIIHDAVNERGWDINTPERREVETPEYWKEVIKETIALVHDKMAAMDDTPERNPDLDAQIREAVIDRWQEEAAISFEVDVRELIGDVKSEE
jgi:hypothetical protein